MYRRGNFSDLGIRVLSVKASTFDLPVTYKLRLAAAVDRANVFLAQISPEGFLAGKVTDTTAEDAYNASKKMANSKVHGLLSFPAGNLADKKQKRKHTVVVHQNDAMEEVSMVFDIPSDQGSPQKKLKKASSERTRARKSEADNDVNGSASGSQTLMTEKPSALFNPIKGRGWTSSIAIPGSIIANVSGIEGKTKLAGRIGRTAAVFCVDEIVVFDDDPSNIPSYINNRYRQRNKSKQETLDSIREDDQPFQNPDQFLFHVLSYAECPPYLRTDPQNRDASLFPWHPNLKYAGLLPSLDMPHHLKNYEWCRFREGVAQGPAKPRAKATPKGKEKKRKSNATVEQEDWTYVECGFPSPVKVPYKIPPSTRVTLRFTDPEQPPSWPHLSKEECESLEVEPVDPVTPREEDGYYWGYNVRRATSLSDVITSCEFEDGYDVSIGTSERGVPLTSVLPNAVAPPRLRSIMSEEDKQPAQLPSSFKHLLLVFGGVAGLEPAVASDPVLKEKGLTKETTHALFDAWVNVVPGQGSRTIRTEEAVEFGLYGVKEYVDSMYD